jgi:hypothetical protein
MPHHDGKVIVLGAGFSTVAGHPVMADFATTAINLTLDHSNALTDEQRSRFTNVLRYRSEKARVYANVYLDLDNLENLFGLLDMEASLKADDETNQIRDDLIYVLVKTLDMTYKIGEPLASDLADLKLNLRTKEARLLRKTAGTHPSHRYGDFIKSLRPHDSILTFNYDTALEDALLAEDLAPDYSFQSPLWVDTERSQLVLKMHGSVNFADKGDGSTEVVDFELLREPTLVYYQAGKPLLVPPTWNKANPGGPIQAIWSRAWQQLVAASHLVFIGFSLPDSDLFFRYLLASALARNTTLQTVKVLDPSEVVLERYKSFFSEALRNQHKFIPIKNSFENAWHVAILP